MMLRLSDIGAISNCCVTCQAKCLLIQKRSETDKHENKCSKKRYKLKKTPSLATKFRVLLADAKLLTIEESERQCNSYFRGNRPRKMSGISTGVSTSQW